MTQEPKQAFVDEAVALLVKHFGVAAVRTALENVSDGRVKSTRSRPARDSSKRSGSSSPTVTSMLEQLRQDDEVKYRLLVGFYTQLKDRTVLPESQDMRHFAHRIGLKGLHGKSRKDMVPRLMRFLLDQPIDRLQTHMETAASVSELNRRKGFSVITDKLMGEKPEKQ